MAGFDSPITYGDDRVDWDSAQVSYNGDLLLIGFVNGATVSSGVVAGSSGSDDFSGSVAGVIFSTGIVTGVINVSGEVAGQAVSTGLITGSVQLSGSVTGNTVSSGTVFEANTPSIQVNNSLPLVMLPPMSSVPYLSPVGLLDGVILTAGMVAGTKRLIEDDDVEVLTLLGVL